MDGLVEYHEWTPSGIFIPIEACCNCNLTQTEKFVFGYISNFDKKSSGCFASNKYLGKLVGVKEQSISNALSKLQEYKYVIIEIEKSSKGTSRRIFINPDYQLIYKPLVNAFYDNKHLEPEALLEILYPTISTIISGYHLNDSVYNKRLLSKDDNLSGSKEPESTAAQCATSAGSSFLQEKPKIKIVRETKPVHSSLLSLSRYTAEAKQLLIFWNSLPEPIKHHLVDAKHVNNKIVIRSLEALDRKLNMGFTLIR